jgi:hypothetical protein
VPVAPDVNAVVRHVERHVADEPHAALARVFLQLVPLPEEVVLDGLVDAHAVAVRLLAAPLRPARAAVRVLERHEVGVRVEPVLRLAAEALELLAPVPARAQERGRCLLQQPRFEGHEPVEVHALLR